MANPSWFNQTFYLESKLTQLRASGQTQFTNVLQVQEAIAAAGLTPLEHFNAYSLVERTSPSTFFNTQEYLEAKAAQLNANAVQGITSWTANSVQLAFADAGFTNAYAHFAQYGWDESVNPSNQFDVSAYLDEQAAAAGVSVEEVTAAFVRDGLDPITHFEQYGREAGLVAPPVPADEQVSPAPDGSTGTAFLTSGIDNVTANQIFATPVVSELTGATLQTLNSGDSLTGTGENPTLNLIWTQPGAVVTVVAPSMSDVQTLNLSQLSAGPLTIAGNNVQGLTAINSADQVGTFNLTNTQTALETLTLTNTGNASTTVTVADTALAGEEDAVAISLNGVGTPGLIPGGGRVSVAAAIGNETYETVSLESLGTNGNVIGQLISDAPTLTVTGDAALTINAPLSNSATTVDATEFAADLSLITGNADINITGGAGDDLFGFLPGQLTTADVVDGGEGVNTIRADFNDLARIEAANSNITQIQTLLVDSPATAGSTIRADFIGDAVTTVNFAANFLGANTTVGFAGGAFAISLTNALGFNSPFSSYGDLTVEANTEGTSDALTLTINPDDLTTAGIDRGDYTVGDIILNTADKEVESLTIVSSNAATTHTVGAIDMAPTPDVDDAVTIEGNATLTLNGNVSADSLDASAMTGLAALDMGANTATRAIEITGTANDDTLNGSIFSDVIIGGAGDDEINGREGADRLTGGSGDDNFLVGTSTATVAGAVVRLSIVAENADAITDLDFGGEDESARVDTLEGFNIAQIAVVDAAEATLDAASFLTDINTALTTSAIDEVQIVTADGGDLLGRSWLVQDTDGNGSLDAGELLIEITGYQGTMDVSDFV